MSDCTCPTIDDEVRVCDLNCPDHAEILKLQMKLGVCGCGDPTATWVWLRDILRVLGSQKCNDARHEKQDALMPGDAIQQFVLGVLENAGLTEHGTSCAGSWLTPEGEAALKQLELYAEVM